MALAQANRTEILEIYANVCNPYCEREDISGGISGRHCMGKEKN